MKGHTDATDNTEDSHIERQIEDSVFSDTAQWPCYYSFIKDIQMIFCKHSIAFLAFIYLMATFAP